MAAKYCPTCQKTFASTERQCPYDGSVLSLNDPYRLVGRTLLDKYRLDALVGLGGMGAVYYAYHSGIDRHVAFKILQPNIAIGDEHVVELFEREAKLAGRLTHENIVDVKDAGHTDEGIAYIVMEWLEGRTLEEELSELGQLDFKRAAGIVRQIAAALGEAHGKHVIHRDLKPGNIMLVDAPDGRDHVKVLDFGIGKVIEETTSSSPVSAVMGTPHYASPEQLTVGGNIDGRSDIYTLGIILYRMLGGKLPFNSSSMGELIEMQLTATPAPLTRLRPETPPRIERLVSRMLAKDPEQRPQSAAEVTALLDQALGHLGIAGRVAAGMADDTPADAATIQRKPYLAEQTTEEMVNAAPSREHSFSTNVSSKSRVKFSALYAAMIGVVVIASGYGLYRYVSDVPANSDQGEKSPDSGAARPSPKIDDQRENTPDSGAARPSPAQTGAQVLAPAPGPNGKAAPAAPSDRRAPAAATKSATKPTERTDQPPGKRRQDDSARLSRVRQEDLRQADRHFERAQALRLKGQHRAALVECKEALRLDPNHAKARELRRQIEATIRILNN